MLGSGLQFGRTSGENRFYNPAKPPRNLENRQSQDPIRRAQSDVAVVSQSPSTKGNSVEREQESGCGPVETPPPIATPVVSPLCNLERFLESITPSIPAQYLSKTSTRERRTCDVEFLSYFVLGDLWESFKEWSAYGAGVPLILNDSDSVVQYYVPYLSAIQIYGYPSTCSVKSRRPVEDTYGDYFRDSCSDGSSDCEHDRSLTLREQHNHPCFMSEIPLRIEEGFSSDEGESHTRQGCLLFEYLERDQPYGRVPLADKILDLSLSFPELKTLRSCDILSSSWISVAWYPIYRIPVGQTLEDLNACFLTFHSLDTTQSGLRRDHAAAMDGVSRISLPVFGLASYKFKASRWTSSGGSEGHLINSLLQAAEEWLTLLSVNHPDFLFFRGRRY